MSRVANRCPGGIAAFTVTLSPAGRRKFNPTAVSFLTTATLSRGSTMIAKSLICGSLAATVSNINVISVDQEEHTTSHPGADAPEDLDFRPPALRGGPDRSVM